MYVPTNHIYFGDIQIYPTSAVSYPDLSVQEGVQVFLTGGMALSPYVRVGQAEAPGLEGQIRAEGGAGTEGAEAPRT